MTTESLLDRYEEYRTRRFLKNEEITGGWMPNWRTRRRRRILAVAVMVLIALMFVASIASYFTMAAAIAWLPVTLVFLPTWTCLQIVSGSSPMHPVAPSMNARSPSATAPARSVCPWRRAC